MAQHDLCCTSTLIQNPSRFWPLTLRVTQNIGLNFSFSLSEQRWMAAEMECVWFKVYAAINNLEIPSTLSPSYSLRQTMIFVDSTLLRQEGLKSSSWLHSLMIFDGLGWGKRWLPMELLSDPLSSKQLFQQPRARTQTALPLFIKVIEQEVMVKGDFFKREELMKRPVKIFVSLEFL